MECGACHHTSCRYSFVNRNRITLRFIYIFIIVKNIQVLRMVLRWKKYKKYVNYYLFFLLSRVVQTIRISFLAVFSTRLSTVHCCYASAAVWTRYTRDSRRLSCTWSSTPSTVLWPRTPTRTPSKLWTRSTPSPDSGGCLRHDHCPKNLRGKSFGKN